MRHRCGFVGPVYYDELVPDRPTGPPIVLVHGGGLTGACYLVTPDGRPGWAHVLADNGFPVLVPDWPGVGRSASVPSLDGAAVCAGLSGLIERFDEVVLVVHSMSGPFGFRLLETHGSRIRALVAVAPGPPGNIQPTPAVLAETDTEIEIQGAALRWRIPKSGVYRPAAGFLTDKLIGASSRFPRGAVDALRVQLVPVPARLLHERQNVHGSQLRVAADRLAGKPVLVVTGDRDTDHPRAHDAEIVRWLADAGAKTTFRFLDDPAHTGNGHLLMSEDNSDAIAQLIIDWLR